MSTNDRELLELAAKAAGYDLVTHTGYDDDDGVYVTHTWIREDVLLVRWNPLLSDGDALRLAVCLGISVDQVRTPMNPYAYAATFDDGFEEGYADNNADPYAATRRAIVRAAAEIGKQ
jgi:hypothetical protein